MSKINWDTVTKNERVKELLLQRESIEDEIKSLDDCALINYELEKLGI